MQIDIGEVIIDAMQSGGSRRTSRERRLREEKENRFAQSAFVGIQNLMD